MSKLVPHLFCVGCHILLFLLESQLFVGAGSLHGLLHLKKDHGESSQGYVELQSCQTNFHDLRIHKPHVCLMKRVALFSDELQVTWENPPITTNRGVHGVFGNLRYQILRSYLLVPNPWRSLEFRFETPTNTAFTTFRTANPNLERN